MSMADWCSFKQEKATKEFVERVNELRRQRNKGPLSWNTAVKFLMARKFDVARAVSLYEQHESTRYREGLVDLKPNVDPLKSELCTGKFTILPRRDCSGAAIAVFTARLHDPKLTDHQTTLQGVVYQLDAALESSETQRCGLIFIYDMSDSVYQNFDYHLSQKILTLLKGGYPARLKKVLIVTAPLWFRAPFRVLRLFVREKLRDRVYTISLPELTNHIPECSLPVDLGGTLPSRHQIWLEECFIIMTNRRSSELCDVTPVLKDQENSDAPPVNGNDASLITSDDATLDEVCDDMSDDDDDEQSSCEQSFSNEEEGIENRGSLVDISDEQKEIASVNGIVGPIPSAQVIGERSTSPSAPPSSGSSGFSDDDSLHYDDGQGMTLEEFVNYLKHMGRQGLYNDYTLIKNKKPEGVFENSRKRWNQLKNRYTDVLCFDHSRVVLTPEDPEGHSDYINANYVDGYKQKNAFISTQGPLPITTEDFWRMIWEQKVCIIVMTTRVMERGRPKCAVYWPDKQGIRCSLGNFTISNLRIEQFPDYLVSHLSVLNSKTGKEHSVEHFQFTSWPDYGVPDSALAMLSFLEHVRRAQARLTSDLGSNWTGHPLGPPIVVHCSAGIGRTGTFCTLDICIQRLEATGTINVKSTVEKIRSQRAYSIQMPDQYVFCHLALLEYALSKGKILEVDLTGFEEDGSDSD